MRFSIVFICLLLVLASPSTPAVAQQTAVGKSSTDLKLEQLRNEIAAEELALA